MANAGSYPPGKAEPEEIDPESGLVRLEEFDSIAPTSPDSLSPPLRRFVEAFETRANQLHEDRSVHRIPSFVASNVYIAHAALHQLLGAGVVPGRTFCEWGSGLGGPTGVAALLGFDACGIEIEPRLVEEATRLAREHQIETAFHAGSYLPEGAFSENVETPVFDPALGFSPVEFDVIYVYPWPAEVGLVFDLIGRFARAGTIVVSFYGGSTLRVHRRT